MENNRAKNRIKWEGLVSKYEKSGQTVMGFCQRHQIKAYTFHYWKRKLSERIEEEGQGFVTLHPGQVGSSIFIRCQNGLELELPGDYPPESLGQLMRSISC